MEFRINDTVIDRRTRRVGIVRNICEEAPMEARMLVEFFAQKEIPKELRYYTRDGRIPPDQYPMLRHYQVFGKR